MKTKKAHENPNLKAWNLYKVCRSHYKENPQMLVTTSALWFGRRKRLKLYKGFLIEKKEKK